MYTLRESSRGNRNVSLWQLALNNEAASTVYVRLNAKQREWIVCVPIVPVSLRQADGSPDHTVCMVHAQCTIRAPWYGTDLLRKPPPPHIICRHRVILREAVPRERSLETLCPHHQQQQPAERETLFFRHGRRPTGLLIGCHDGACGFAQARREPLQFDAPRRPPMIAVRPVTAAALLGEHASPSTSLHPRYRTDLVAQPMKTSSRGGGSSSHRHRRKRRPASGLARLVPPLSSLSLSLESHGGDDAEAAFLSAPQHLRCACSCLSVFRSIGSLPPRRASSPFSPLISPFWGCNRRHIRATKADRARQRRTRKRPDKAKKKRDKVECSRICDARTAERTKERRSEQRFGYRALEPRQRKRRRDRRWTRRLGKPICGATLPRASGVGTATNPIVHGVSNRTQPERIAAQIPL
ncbi:hypothetical protein HPB51_021722 [Rhipicephalus microplus]|uniref:Uncharacterized protein n=1 Tax=Rhipicephalus microplus TaxID=6941 RepID=A0A9J6DPB0_RHIMP|nr:hypothetical protein HPB51_021722 [Rhipicephalus microplus]